MHTCTQHIAHSTQFRTPQQGVILNVIVCCYFRVFECACAHVCAGCASTRCTHNRAPRHRCTSTFLKKIPLELNKIPSLKTKFSELGVHLSIFSLKKCKLILDSPFVLVLARELRHLRLLTNSTMPEHVHT